MAGRALLHPRVAASFQSSIGRPHETRPGMEMLEWVASEEESVRDLWYQSCCLCSEAERMHWSTSVLPSQPQVLGEQENGGEMHDPGSRTTGDVDE